MCEKVLDRLETVHQRLLHRPEQRVLMREIQESFIIDIAMARMVHCTFPLLAAPTLLALIFVAEVFYMLTLTEQTGEILTRFPQAN